MKFNQKTYFLFLLLWISFRANSQCIYDKKTSNCLFCSENYYDSSSLIHFLENSFPEPKDCIPKDIFFCSRKIIVLNKLFQSNFTSFDSCYFNLMEALINESYVFNINCQFSELEIELTKGEHFIINQNFQSSFFKRMNISLILHPLSCSELNISEICNNEEEAPVVMYKSGIFTMFVSAVLKIHKITFQLDWGVNFKFNPELSSKNLIIFHIEALFDNPNKKLPELFMENVRFLQFNDLPYIFNIIYVSCFDHLRISQIEVFDSFSFLFLIKYNDLFLENSKNNSSLLEISNILISDTKTNVESAPLNCNYNLHNGFIEIINFHGILLIQNISFSNIATLSKFYFIKLTAVQTNIVIENVILQNTISFKLFIFIETNITLTNFTMIDSTWSSPCIYLEKSELILKESKLINSSTNDIFDQSNIFFLSTNSRILFEKVDFVSLSALSLKILNSSFVLNCSLFHQIRMISSIIKLDFCQDVIVMNSQFLNCGFDIRSDIKYRLFYCIAFVSIVTSQKILFFNNSFDNGVAGYLVSRFIECHLIEFQVNLTANIFKGSKETNIFISSPFINLINNKFHDLGCSNLELFTKNNGAISLEGFNTQNLKKNCTIIRNLFFNCNCSKSGSLQISNYDNVAIETLVIINSTSIFNGNLYIVNSYHINCNHVFFESVKGYESSGIVLENTFIIKFNKSIFIDGLSQIYGTIQTYNVNNAKFENIVGENQVTSFKGGVFYLTSGSTQISNSSFFDIISYKSGSVIYLKLNGSLTINNCLFYNTKASMGGAIDILNGFFVGINNSSFVNSYSLNIGGAILIEELENFIMDSVSFSGCETENGVVYLKDAENFGNFSFFNVICTLCKAAAFGSCIFAENKGKIFLRNFSSNSNFGNVLRFSAQNNLIVELITGKFFNCSAGNLIFGKEVIILIESLVLVENYCSEEIFKFLFSSLLINYMNATHNIDNNTGDVPLTFNLKSTELNATRIISQITDNFIKMKTFIIAKNSVVNISFSDFINLRKFQNPFISIENGQINLEHVLIKKQSGIIIFVMDSNFTIKNSIITSESDSNLMITSKIEKSIFLLFNCSFDSLIEIEGLNFIYLADSSFIQFGLQISNSFIINITNSRFQNCSKIIGGAIFFESNSINQMNIQVFNSSFFYNFASYGGAFVVKGNFSINILNSAFLGNFAFSSQDIFSGIGGVGVLISNSNYCQIHLENNIFEKNFAEFIAPTLFSTIPVNEINSFYNANNDGSNFTDRISFLPFRLKLYAKKSSFVVDSENPFKLEFYLSDDFGKIVPLKKMVNLKILSLSDKNTIFIKKAICPSSNNGIFYCRNILIQASPNLNFTLEASVSLANQFFSEKLDFQTTIKLFSRSCVVGEIQIPGFGCKMCQFNSFCLGDSMKSNQTCKKCVANAFCPGGAFLIPNSGFWRFSNETILILPCPLSEACEGFSNLNLSELTQNYNQLIVEEDLIHGRCLLGHEGNLCNQCKPGFGQSNSKNICVRCQDMIFLSYIRIILTLFFASAYVLFNAKTGFKSGYLIELLRGVSKICFNHIQKLSIIFYMDYNKPILHMTDFVSSVDNLSFLDEENFSNQCFFSVITQIPSNDETYVLFKVISTTFSPVFIAICASILCLILSFLKKKHHQHSKKKFVLIFIISIYLFYPLVIKLSLSLINCVHLDESPNLYIHSLSNILCWSYPHKFMVLIAWVAGLFLCGCVCPLLVMISIKNTLYPGKKENFKVATAISTENYKLSFQQKTNVSYVDSNKKKTEVKLTVEGGTFVFFHRDYRKEYFYWEMIVFFYKMSLSILPNLLNFVKNEQIDVILASVICVYMFCIIFAEPFKERRLNNLELLSNIVVISSRIFIVLARSFGENEKGLIFVSLCFVLINLFFLIVACYFVFKYGSLKETLAKYGKKIPGLRRIFEKLMQCNPKKNYLKPEFIAKKSVLKF